MKAVLIPADKAEQIREVELRDGVSQLEDLQELVGGYIEAMNFAPGLTAYGDEESKLKSVPIAWADGEPIEWQEGGVENERATRLIYGDKKKARRREAQAKAEYAAAGYAVIDASTGDPREPFIAGNIVVCGFDPTTGENLPLEMDEFKDRVWADLMFRQATDN